MKKILNEISDSSTVAAQKPEQHKRGVEWYFYALSKVPATRILVPEGAKYCSLSPSCFANFKCPSRPLSVHETLKVVTLKLP